MRAHEETAAMWDEVNQQQALTHRLGQRTCGYTTHRVPACGWCGACV